MKFSIIVPIYKVEEYLGECVDSVLAQDYTDYELILVDDGSPDNCGKICDEYAQKYPNIKVIHKENGGLSDARNFGIKQAEGDYLIFLDSDDYWKGTTILSDLSQITERDNCPDLVLYSFIYSNNLSQHTYFLSYNKENKGFENDFENLIKDGIYYSNAWTKIIKRNIIIDNHLFFEKGLLHEDFPFSFDLAFFIKTYSIYHSNFYQYRVREESISFQLGEKNIQHLTKSILNKLNELIKLDNKNPIKEGLKIYVYSNFSYCFPYRSFLDCFFNYNKLSFKDRIKLLLLQNKIWDKCCKVYGEKYMRDTIFGDRKIKNLPFIFVVFINYFMGKYYEMRNG